ncbi:hypothetical protein CMI45_00495 [Candidatus Pacearchaeota archaeon]|nr:hypothetical protein [Candidatus Pacearchaeota archaeon]|tara:strand:- start:89 stop:487 length:399 start_codon:yes stop_codon:yes gene_type:complete
MRINKKASKLAALFLAPAVSLTACNVFRPSDTSPGYTVNPDLQRHVSNNSPQSWEHLYNIIGSPEFYGSPKPMATISHEESKFHAKFKKLSKRKQKQMFENSGADEFDFVNTKDPQFRDIIFLYNLKNQTSN